MAFPGIPLAGDISGLISSVHQILHVTIHAIKTKSGTMVVRHSAEKRTFVQAVNDCAYPDVSRKSQAATTSSASNNVDMTADDTRSLEELTEEMVFKTREEQFVFACMNGTDEVSLQLLMNMTGLKNSKLDRIKDKVSQASLLHICALKNKYRCMELFLSLNLKVDAWDAVQATPLMYAAANNSLDAAVLLLTARANINARDAYNKSALLLALKNKHYRMVELLTTHQSIDIHLKGRKGNTVLHCVAEDGDLYAVQHLMSRCNASPQRRNSDEENVLSVSLSHPDIVEYICKNVDRRVLNKMAMNQNTEGNTIIHQCASNGHLNSLLVVLKNMDISELSMADVSDLLNKPNRSGDSPLLLAVKNNHVDITRFLYSCQELKVNQPDMDGNTAFYYAAKNQEIMTLLSMVGGSLKPELEQEKDESLGVVEYSVRSLSTSLAIILSLVAIICIICIAAISIGFFASNITQSAQVIRKKYFTEIMGVVNQTVQDISLAEEMSVVQTKSPHFDVTEELSVREYTGAAFFKALSRLPIITGVYCGLGNYSGTSQLVGYSRYEQDFSRMYYFANYANVTPALGVFITDYDNYLEFNQSNVFYYDASPSPEPIYNALARNSTTSIWTPSYTSPTYKGVMFLTISHPIRDKDTNEYKGFCAFDAATQTLNDYLLQNANQQESVTVVIERSTGYLIGTSDITVPLYDDSGSQTIRFDGLNAKNKRMSAMLRYARSKHGGPRLSHVSSSNVYDSFMLRGEKNALNIGRVSDEFGLDWLVIQALPMKNFYTRFYTSIIIMIVVTLTLLCISIVISIFIAYSFMRPLNQLIQQVEAVRMMQLDDVEKSMKRGFSFFSEIRTLQQSFRSMSLRLKQLRNFIPDHILAMIETEFGQSKLNQHNEPIATTALRISAEETASDPATESRASFSAPRMRSRDLVNKALSSGLSSGVVTIMSIRFPDYTQLLDNHSATDITDANRELLSQFMDCIRLSRGQFVSINSLEAVVAWNTYVQQGDHRHRACKTAHSCLQALKSLHKEWAAKALPLLNVTMAISSGSTYFGNMGTERMKYFTVIGSAATRVSQVSQLGQKWDISIMCDEAIQKTVKHEYQLRQVDTVEESDQVVPIFELGEVYPPDAWAEDLQNTDSANKWSEFNAAYDLYSKGQYEEALDKFINYSQKDSKDPICAHYISQCKSLRDDAATEATATF